VTEPPCPARARASPPIFPAGACRLRPRQAARLFVASALIALACARRTPEARAPAAAGEPTPALPSPFETVSATRRPVVRLLFRAGDPTGAVAIVVATGVDPRAAAALAGLVEHRLAAAHLPGLEVQSHALGFGVAAPSLTAAEAARATDALLAALRAPVEAHEAAAPPVRARVEALRAHAAPGVHAAAARACAGEPVADPAHPPAPVRAEELERWRAAACSSRALAVGAVGAEPLLEAVARAVARSKPWPDGPAVADPWPAADVIGVDHASSPRGLDLALRVGDGAAAVAAAGALGDPRGPLCERIAALDPRWRVARVTATTRVSGGCLWLELAGPADASEPAAAQIARLAAVAREESELAVEAGADGGFALEQRILGATDPRAAARLLAWSALARPAAGAPTRRVVAYATPAERAAVDRDLERMLAATPRDGGRARLTMRSRVERGQGELWALVGSPCGTAGESTTTAGHRALALRALVRSYDGAGGVALEPWITPDGVGLLAHAPRARTDETPNEQAARVGDALGRALVTARLDGVALATERAQLAADLGPGTRPDWWLLLETLAPGHPSWLEPRGTFASIDGAGTEAAETERRRLLGEPLRLAVLANWEATQAETLAAALGRWLGTTRDPDRRCAPLAAAPAAAATVELTADGAAERARAHLGYSLGPDAAAARQEAEIARWLLAREGGWLDAALAGLTASARVELLGGTRLGAVVVTVEATPEDRDAAITAVRELFARVARTPPAGADVTRGLEVFATSAARGSLDPRRRIVELWRDAGVRPPTAASLARFLSAAFSPDHLVLLRVSSPPRPPAAPKGAAAR